MTDAAMALHLHLSAVTVAIYRQSLGLKRFAKSDEGASEVVRDGDHYASSVLTSEQKKEVLEKLPAIALSDIAIQLGVSLSEIFRARNEIAKDFIVKNWETMTDGEMAKQLGFGRIMTRIVKYRSELNLSRHEQRRKIPADFNLADLKKAITEDGETLTGYAKKMGLHVTRERLSQLAETIGVNPLNDRTPKWYATKYGKPDLGDKSVVEKLLSEKKSVFAAAAAVGITDAIFKRMCELHQIELPTSNVEMIPLSCSHCGTTLWRSKALVDRSPNKKHWFCKKQCRDESGFLKVPRLGAIQLVCSNPACHKQFVRPKSVVREDQKNFYCCNECRNVCLPRGQNQGGPKVKMVCDNCGGEYYLAPYRFRQTETSKHHFCKQSCQTEWRQKNKKT
jgi:hypothetical protein